MKQTETMTKIFSALARPFPFNMCDVNPLKATLCLALPEKHVQVI